ncbi:hypothetical protein TKK_0011696 [Trichogramma kaykai]
MRMGQQAPSNLRGGNARHHGKSARTAKVMRTNFDKDRPEDVTTARTEVCPAECLDHDESASASSRVLRLESGQPRDRTHIYLDNCGNSRANTCEPEFRPEMEGTLLLDQNQSVAGSLVHRLPW